MSDFTKEEIEILKALIKRNKHILAYEKYILSMTCTDPDCEGCQMPIPMTYEDWLGDVHTILK